MNVKRVKALEDMKAKFDLHLGHDVTLNSGRTAKLKKTAIIREILFLQLEGDSFPMIYSDEAVKCSCGEGQKQ